MVLDGVILVQLLPVQVEQAAVARVASQRARQSRAPLTPEAVVVPVVTPRAIKLQLTAARAS